MRDYFQRPTVLYLIASNLKPRLAEQVCFLPQQKRAKYRIDISSILKILHRTISVICKTVTANLFDFVATSSCDDEGSDQNDDDDEDAEDDEQGDEHSSC